MSWESFFGAAVTPSLMRSSFDSNSAGGVGVAQERRRSPESPFENSRRRSVLHSRPGRGRGRIYFSSLYLHFRRNCFAVMLFHSGSQWFCLHPHQRRACFRYSSNPCAAAYFFSLLFFSSFVFIKNIWEAKKVVTLQFPVLSKLFS